MAYLILCDGEILHDSRLDNLRVLSPQLTLALNTSGKLTFGLPATHPLYAIPAKLASVIRVEEVGVSEPLFVGRVLSDEMGMDKTKQVECEGDLGYLVDTVQRPWSFEGDPTELLTLFIDTHNAQKADTLGQQFNVGFVDVTDPNDYIVRSSEDYLNTYEAAKQKLWESSLGGYIRTRGGGQIRYIDYTEEAGPISRQVIRFGDNLLDFKRAVRGEEVITAIIPLGAEVDYTYYPNGEPPTEGEYNPDDYPVATEKRRVNITGLTPNGEDYIVDEEAAAAYGVIFTQQTWDDVTLPHNLMQRAHDFLAANSALAITLELNALDLHALDVDADRLRLGDKVRVVSEPHGVDAYLTINAMTVDIDNPAGTTITLGAKQASLYGESSKQINKTADEVRRQISEKYATNESVADVKHDVLTLESQITQTAEEIIFSVSEEYATKTALEQTTENLQAAIDLQADNITIKFDEATSYTQSVEDAFLQAQDELHTYIRFDADGMEMGKSDSPFVMALTNEQLAFLQNGNPVAYLSSNKLYVTDAEVLNSLRLGNFAFVPRANGNLSFLKVT